MVVVALQVVVLHLVEVEDAQAEVVEVGDVVAVGVGDVVDKYF